MTAEEAMAALHAVEDRFDRVRGERNAPRTLDLDLVAYGRRVGAAPVTPHPRAHERRFVMGPLAEIAPDWRHPALGKAAHALARDATVGRDAVPLHSVAGPDMARLSAAINAAPSKAEIAGVMLGVAGIAIVLAELARPRTGPPPVAVGAALALAGSLSVALYVLRLSKAARELRSLPRIRRGK